MSVCMYDCISWLVLFHTYIYCIYINMVNSSTTESTSAGSNTNNVVVGAPVAVVGGGKQAVVPHLLIPVGSIHPIVLVVGDPFRAEYIAKEFCTSYEQLAFNREYRTFNCKFHLDGCTTDVTICSHGIGGPGAAICFEELIKVGAKCIIRLGTCGSLQPDLIKQGDLCITQCSIREDGLSESIVPSPGFPCMANIQVIQALQQAAALTIPNKVVHSGLTLCSNVFYPFDSESHTQHLKKCAKAGALIVEMETSCLLTICMLRGNIQAGAIATADGSPIP